MVIHELYMPNTNTSKTENNTRDKQMTLHMIPNKGGSGRFRTVNSVQQAQCFAFRLKVQGLCAFFLCACMHVWNKNKAEVVPLICCRGHCIPLWVVLPSLQVVLSFACSVASLSRFPSHYLPCQLRLPETATADYLFDKGQPIHAACRTFNSPWHSLSHTPVRGTEKHCHPQCHYFIVWMWTCIQCHCFMVWM